MAYPRFQRARDFKYLNRTAGDLTLLANTAVWTDLTAAMDLTLTAQIGDVIEYSIGGIMLSNNTEAVITPATIVSGTAVNQFAPGAYGVQFYAYSAIPNVLTGSVMYTLTGGDISNGTVTLRMQYKKSGSGAATLSAGATYGLQIWAKNLGPGDPN